VDVEVDAAPNGDETDGRAVAKGDAAEAYALKPEDPNVTGAETCGALLLKGVVAEGMEDAGGLGMLLVPNVGGGLVDPKTLGAFLDAAKGEAGEA
jgi:hypothetical protein